jgi:hypothetical protein
MTKPKPAIELTNEGVLRRVFPKPIRDALRAEVKKLNAPKKRKS